MDTYRALVQQAQTEANLQQCTIFMILNAANQIENAYMRTPRTLETFTPLVEPATPPRPTARRGYPAGS